MKALKIIYIVIVSYCALQLLLFSLMPFVGPLGIYYFMRDGLFTAQDGFNVIPTNEIYYPNNIYVRNLALFNRICTIGYFSSLLAVCLSLALRKIKPINRYKTGFIFFIFSLMFAYGGYAIWRHYVGVYIEGKH